MSAWSLREGTARNLPGNGSEVVDAAHSQPFAVTAGAFVRAAVTVRLFAVVDHQRHPRHPAHGLGLQTTHDEPAIGASSGVDGSDH